MSHTKVSDILCKHGQNVLERCVKCGRDESRALENCYDAIEYLERQLASTLSKAKAQLSRVMPTLENTPEDIGECIDLMQYKYAVRTEALERQLAEAQGSFEASISRLADENNRLLKRNVELVEALKEIKKECEDSPLLGYHGYVIGRSGRAIASVEGKACNCRNSYEVGSGAFVHDSTCHKGIIEREEWYKYKQRQLEDKA